VLQRHQLVILQNVGEVGCNHPAAEEPGPGRGGRGRPCLPAATGRVPRFACSAGSPGSVVQTLCAAKLKTHPKPQTPQAHKNF